VAFRINRTLWLVSITSLLTDVSSEMVYPLMPMFVTEVLGASTGVLGIVEGVAESIASFARIGGGAWSDRVGRRKPLAAAGYACSVVGKILLATATIWPVFLGGRAVDRIGKGIRNPPRDALISECYPKEQLGRAFGVHRLMDTTGAALGVIAAYFLFTRYALDPSHTHSAPYRALFLWSILPAALALIAIGMVREEGKRQTPRSDRLQFRHVLREFSALPRDLKAFLLITLVFTLGNSSNQFLLLRARNLGHSDSTVILIYLVYNIVYALASYPAGRIADLVGKRHVLVVGYVIFGLVYLAFAWLNSPGATWALFGVYGGYMALTEGVEKALVAQLAPAHRKATVLGLHATIVGAGLLPASIIAGQLWDRIGPQATFTVGAVTGFLAAIGLWISLRGR
jgi:MFS family permease